MCGIVAYLCVLFLVACFEWHQRSPRKANRPPFLPLFHSGIRQALPLLIKGLKRLEYRGYDSSGVGLLVNDGTKSSLRIVKKKVCGFKARCTLRANNKTSNQPPSPSSLPFSSGQSREPRVRICRFSVGIHRGHRTHALGDAWAPQRRQRAPARRRIAQRRRRPQRHHREFPIAARCAAD